MTLISNRRSDHGSAAFLIGFLVGATAGTATALLMAPMSGKETRSLIEDKAMAAKTMVENVASDAAAQVQHARDVGSDILTKASEQVQHAREVGIDLLTRTSEKLSDLMPKNMQPTMDEPVSSAVEDRYLD